MTEKLQYGWEWNQREAVFSVDLRYWELLPSLAYPYLITVVCEPLDSEAKTFTLREQRRVEELRRTLEELLKDHAVSVGAVSFSDLVRFYYYAADQTLMSNVITVCRNVTRLRVHCGCEQESRYTTYYRLLFPDDAKLQSIENAAYIESVREQDGDLTLVRRIRLNMAFPTEEACDAFLPTIPLAGFTMGKRKSVSHPTHPYRVELLGFSTLQLHDLNRCTTRAIHAALPFDGVLDDLEAEFIPRT